MTWAISVAIFLVAVFAVLAVILAWSRREEIRAALREHRGESRKPVDIPLELSNLDKSFVETATAENISRHGARVLTRTRWRPNDRVLVGLPQAVRRSRARIAYCQLLPGDSFGVGLKFSAAFDEWSFGFQRSDHPSRK
jgi:PilZ domain